MVLLLDVSVCSLWRIRETPRHPRRFDDAFQFALANDLHPHPCFSKPSLIDIVAASGFSIVQSQGRHSYRGFLHLNCGKHIRSAFGCQRNCSHFRRFSMSMLINATPCGSRVETCLFAEQSAGSGRPLTGTHGRDSPVSEKRFADCRTMGWASRLG
jgi:hypothetical protein